MAQRTCARHQKDTDTMGDIFKIASVLLWTLFSSCFARGQIVSSYCMSDYFKDEIDSLVLKFWERTHEPQIYFPISSVSDLSFGTNDSTILWTIYEPIDSMFSIHYADSNNIIRRLSHTNIEIDQVVLFNEGYLYLIDMRNPLPQIIKSIKDCEELSNTYIDRVIGEVTKVHKSNWYIRHWTCNDSETDILFNEDIFDNDNVDVVKEQYRVEEW